MEPFAGRGRAQLRWEVRAGGLPPRAMRVGGEGPGFRMPGLRMLVLVEAPGPQHGQRGRGLMKFQTTSGARWPPASSSGWSASRAAAGTDPRAGGRRPVTGKPTARKVCAACRAPHTGSSKGGQGDCVWDGPHPCLPTERMAEKGTSVCRETLATVGLGL